MDRKSNSIEFYIMGLTALVLSLSQAEKPLPIVVAPILINNVHRRHYHHPWCNIRISSSDNFRLAISRISLLPPPCQGTTTLSGSQTAAFCFCKSTAPPTCHFGPKGEGLPRERATGLPCRNFLVSGAASSGSSSCSPWLA